MAALLAALVDKSVVIAERPRVAGGTRYRLLGALRGFGREQLVQEGRLRSHQARHARHYLDVARQANAALRRAGDRAWRVRVERDFANLRAAHATAMAIGDHEVALGLPAAMARYGHLHLRTEVFLWAQHALADPRFGAARGALAAEAWAAAAMGALLDGDHATARDRCDSGLAAAAVRRDRRQPLYVLGMADLLSGQLADAVRCYQEALAHADDAGDHYAATVWLSPLTLARAFSQVSTRRPASCSSGRPRCSTSSGTAAPRPRSPLHPRDVELRVRPRCRRHSARTLPRRVPGGRVLVPHRGRARRTHGAARGPERPGCGAAHLPADRRGVAPGRGSRGTGLHDGPARRVPGTSRRARTAATAIGPSRLAS